MNLAELVSSNWTWVALFVLIGAGLTWAGRRRARNLELNPRAISLARPTASEITNQPLDSGRGADLVPVTGAGRSRSHSAAGDRRHGCC